MKAEPHTHEMPAFLPSDHSHISMEYPPCPRCHWPLYSQEDRFCRRCGAELGSVNHRTWAALKRASALGHENDEIVVEVRERLLDRGGEDER